VSQLVTKARPNLLTGSGYRTSARQAQLRILNGCTCSDSSKCCVVPTAPVGQSMHEVGLAIDFSWNGRLIRSHTDTGFKFLAANAPALGLHNLPSEPWHWSTNGK
jgi:D-alanyl-D-alanine carboxypeptidase